MRNFLKTNLYQALQQVSLLISGGIIGFAITKVLEGWNLSCAQTISIAATFLVFSFFGLGYGVFFFYPYVYFNQKLRRVAIFAPYEIEDTVTSSWVHLKIQEFVIALKKLSDRRPYENAIYVDKKIKEAYGA